MPRREQEPVLKPTTLEEAMEEVTSLLEEAVGAVYPLTEEEYKERRNLLEIFKGTNIILNVDQLGVGQKFHLIYVSPPSGVTLHQYVVTLKVRDQGQLLRVEARPLDEGTFERIWFPANHPVLIDIQREELEERKRQLLNRRISDDS